MLCSKTSGFIGVLGHAVPQLFGDVFRFPPPPPQAANSSTDTRAHARRTADLNKVAFIIPHLFGSAFYKILNFRLWCSWPVEVCSGISLPSPGCTAGLLLMKPSSRLSGNSHACTSAGAFTRWPHSPLCPRRTVPVGAGIAGLDQKVQHHQAHDYLDDRSHIARQETPAPRPPKTGR